MCIKKDAFYTPAQRNKLIKEGCRALRGHCWAKDSAVTNDEKSRMLYELAPMSLGVHQSLRLEGSYYCRSVFCQCILAPSIFPPQILFKTTHGEILEGCVSVVFIMYIINHI